MRNVVWSGSLVLMLAVCLSGGIATADDSTSLADKIDAAQASVTSYQVDTTGPGPQNSTLVIVRGVGSRYRTGETVMYTIGSTIYQRTAEAGWRMFRMDPNDLATLSRSATRHRSAEPLPDRTEDGVTVGAAKTVVTLVVPGLEAATSTADPLVCTYDKVTFLLRTCTFGQMTMHYSRYGDPTLTIELPAEAKDAPAVDLPSVLPHPSPQPTSPAVP